MADTLKLYTRNDCLQHVNLRDGETKFGEAIHTTASLEDMTAHPANYVVFGIPEDIGIRANLGKTGARDTWRVFLDAFLNIQVNRFNSPENCLLLGTLNCDYWGSKADQISDTDPNFSAKLHDIITAIDTEVANLVKIICSSGKIPIIIGGGHNNAYGNLRGLSEAHDQPVNALNIDAHTDLRTTDFRHSGNGFSWAIADDFLDTYSIFGLHKNYTPEYIYKQIEVSERVKYWHFEDLLEPSAAISAFKDALAFVANAPFGLEIDCDAIANFPSSAQTPSGFTVEQVRRLIDIAKTAENLSYVHLCEAKPSTTFNISKTLSYLVSDIVRS